jgi:hypothetical protein
MIPLSVVGLSSLAHRPPKVTLADRNQSIQALLVDGSHEPLGECIRIGRPFGGPHDTNPRVGEQPPYIPTPLRIAITVSTWLQRSSAIVRVRAT